MVKDLLMPHLRASHQQLRAAAADADLLISHPLTFMCRWWRPSRASLACHGAGACELPVA